MTTEWIEHDGKSRPNLPGGTLVLVRFRDGVGQGWSPEEFDFWSPDEEDAHDYWLSDGSNNDITHYRVVQS